MRKSASKLLATLLTVAALAVCVPVSAFAKSGKPLSYLYTYQLTFDGYDTMSLSPDDTGTITIFDPEATWKRKTYTDFIARPLQVQVFRKGELVYERPSLQVVQDYCRTQVDSLWDEVKRFENPHNYYVDLSQKLWDIKEALLRQNR